MPPSRAPALAHSLISPPWLPWHTRYFDFKLPTAEVRPSTVSKVNTGLQLLLMGVSLGAPVFGFAGHPALPLLWWSVAGTWPELARGPMRARSDPTNATPRVCTTRAGTTVASGLGYIFKGRQHVVFLTQKSQGGKPGA